MSLDRQFIPLFLGEEDEDIWEALQKFKPEERVSFIKNALRKALSLESEVNKDTFFTTMNYMFKEFTDFKECKVDKVDNEGSEYQYQEYLENNNEDKETMPNCDQVIEFSLEDLLIEDIKPINESNTPNITNGLQHLLDYVIGEEDDEKVINAIVQKNN